MFSMRQVRAVFFNVLSTLMTGDDPVAFKTRSNWFPLFLEVSTFLDEVVVDLRIYRFVAVHGA